MTGLEEERSDDDDGNGDGDGVQRMKERRVNGAPG